MRNSIPGGIQWLTDFRYFKFTARVRVAFVSWTRPRARLKKYRLPPLTALRWRLSHLENLQRAKSSGPVFPAEYSRKKFSV